MSVLRDLEERNAVFAVDGFVHDLKMLPSLRTIVIGCVDPRVDPADIFGLKPGEAAVIRNVGGRINTSLLETVAILGAVARMAGKEVGEGWNLIVLHHTDCGIVPCYRHAPEMLAKYLDVTTTELDGMAIADPYAAVRYDVASLKANLTLPAAITVSGVVYHVGDGRVETVVAPARLRDTPFD